LCLALHQHSLRFSEYTLSWFLRIFFNFLILSFFCISSSTPNVTMVLFKSIFGCLAILLTASAVPLTIPFGTSGQSLSVSEDGQTISIDGESIKLGQGAHASSGGARGHRGRKHQHGKEGVSSNSTSSTNARAIYFLTNGVNNSVVALKVAADGTLSDGSITPTGGAGMSGVDSTGAPAAPDALFSQGALKVAGNVCLLLLISSISANTASFLLL
jgi:hypothetical protein